MTSKLFAGEKLLNVTQIFQEKQQHITRGSTFHGTLKIENHTNDLAKQ